ncbi:MAG: YggT family protein [Pseudomonadales bacterium]|nr:YggT family protein [Pseudomonadales bacterium]
MSSSVNQALLFLVQNIFQLYIFIVLIRFLLQVAKADFYNPMSQFVIKATAPILTPLRRLIPGIAGLDIAALVLALLLQFVMIILIFLIASGTFANPITLLIGTFAGIVNNLVSIYFFGIIISAILSWIPQAQGHPVAQLISQLVEPALAPFRKLLPDMGGIDISPILAIMIFQVLRILLQPYVVV